MSVAVITFPGTNCDKDTIYAYELLGQEVFNIWHKDRILPKDTSLVVLAGGFSYGDYLRCGAIARYSPIMSAIKSFASDGGLVLGICNGFQILCECGLLPGVLIRNENLHFISNTQTLNIICNNNKFLKSYHINQQIKLPIAHAEGNYFIDKDGLESLKQNNQILLTYKNNPNGSIESIAGICNKQKNVFGLMPHPERAIESILGGTDGIDMLKNLILP